MNKKGVWIAALVIVAAIIISAAIFTNEKSKPYDYTDTAMATVVKFRLYGKNKKQITAKMMKQLKDLEKDTLSYRQPNSEVAKINKNAGNCVEISHELYLWLEQIFEVEKKSRGSLDITILPVARLWNIEGENPKIPNNRQLQNALEKVDYDSLKLQGNNRVKLEKGSSMDIGAVGKGIACDVLYRTMKESSLTGGTVCVGGSICVFGKKTDDTFWNLGIQDPRANTGEIFGIYKTKTPCFISTSGDYEKYFEKKGKRYHHIVDPQTGYPADSGLISVTIICDSGLLSDALSTACFIMGLQDGMELAQQYGVKAIFVDRKKNVYVTENLKSSFTIQNKEYKLKE